MSIEDRLRDALRARAAQVQPDDDGWARIEQRISDPRRSLKRFVLVGLAVVTIPGAIAVAAAIRDDNAKPLVVGPMETTTTAVAPTTVPVVARPRYIYPWDDGTRFDTPQALADAFARNFLGMTDPSVGTFRAGDSRSGEIDIHAFAKGVATTLLVRQEATGWMVSSSSTPNIQLDSPEQFDLVESPFPLSGRSVAFEGTVHMTLLSWGTSMRCVPATDTCGSDPRVLANEFFTGHGSELSPFETHLRYDAQGQTTGVLVLWTDSARDGSLQEATIRIVRLLVQ
ncbi:MAG: hypothetical protein QOF21_1950 [Actinomycetota bacterium]|jgi:hypothetical protein